jgi:hypothetical protein
MVVAEFQAILLRQRDGLFFRPRIQLDEMTALHRPGVFLIYPLVNIRHDVLLAAGDALFIERAAEKPMGLAS